MSLLREHADPQKRCAHQLLDRARAGFEVSADEIRWALLTLGDLA